MNQTALALLAGFGTFMLAFPAVLALVLLATPTRWWRQ